LAEWWQSKRLEELSAEEWEALCDGCGKCCLHKIQEDDGSLLFTRVHCRYLDPRSCRCTDYANRFDNVSDCVELGQGNIASLDWLPATCAYRLRARGKPLADWHPLVSGAADSVHRAGISVRGRCISEEYVHPDGLDEHIVHWVE